MTKVAVTCVGCSQTQLMRSGDCGVRRDGRVVFPCPVCGPSSTRRIPRPVLAVIARQIPAATTVRFQPSPPTGLEVN